MKKLAQYFVIAISLAPLFAEAKISSHSTRKVASEAFICQTIEWPFEDLRLDKKAKVLLQSVDRSQVRAYYLFEITSAKIRKDLALDLEEFLTSTEPNSEMRAFYEITARAAELDSKKAVPVPKKEICNLLEHVGNQLPSQ